MPTDAPAPAAQSRSGPGPAIPLTSSPPRYTTHTPPTFRFYAGAGARGRGPPPPRSRRRSHARVPFRFKAGARKARFRCRVRTAPHRGRFRRCRSPRRYRRLRNRTYLFSVFARDRKGRRSRIKDRRFAVDTIPPTARITSGPPLSSRSSSATFRFGASDRSPLSYRCRLGTGSWRSCSSPATFAGLPDGGRRFELQATDAAGNRSQVIPYGWNVYTGPPRPNFSTHPGLGPGFDWETRDYVVRCTGAP